MVRSSSQEEENNENVKRTPSVRSSIYASGTQSAYGSRDASPDKTPSRVVLGVRKISPYPIAPPSMIITPSQTPKRADSVERGPDSFTSEDIQRIYEKLDAIEASENGARTTSGARGGSTSVGARRIPMIKSASVDVAEDASYSKSRVIQSSVASPPVIPATRSSMYVPASNQTTLPTQNQGLHQKQHDKRSQSVSPKTARRQFFEDYPYDPSKMNSGVQQTDVESRTPSDWTRDASSVDRSTMSSQTQTDTAEKKSGFKLFSGGSNFFQNVKEQTKNIRNQEIEQRR